MDSIEITKNAIRITKANGISITQFNKILQGIKKYYSFPVEVQKQRGNCKTTLRRKCNCDVGKLSK